MKKILIVLAFTALCFSCNKKKDEPKIYDVTITCYSETPKFLFTYKDKNSWHSDTVWANNIQVHIEVMESDLPMSQQIKSLIPSSSDSMYIKGEYDGKKIEQGFRSTGGLFQLSVQLSQAH